MTSNVMFATVTRREGDWFVIVKDNVYGDKFIGGFGPHGGRKALEWAVDQNYQVGYRGLTYNEGGTGPKGMR